MSDVRLITERLVLRRMVMADAAALHVALSDPEAMRYWSTLPHRSLAETEAWVGETVAAVATGDADDFAVALDGAVIGKAGLWRHGELGIMLARAYWGRGFAQEALRAVIDRSFAKGIPQIDADVDPRNHACLAVLRRLGFRRIGEAKATFRLGDEWVDSVYLAITPAVRAPQ